MSLIIPCCLIKILTFLLFPLNLKKLSLSLIRIKFSLSLSLLFASNSLSLSFTHNVTFPSTNMWPLSLSVSIEPTTHTHFVKSKHSRTRCIAASQYTYFKYCKSVFLPSLLFIIFPFFHFHRSAALLVFGRKVVSSNWLVTCHEIKTSFRVMASVCGRPADQATSKCFEGHLPRTQSTIIIVIFFPLGQQMKQNGPGSTDDVFIVFAFQLKGFQFSQLKHGPLQAV